MENKEKIYLDLAGKIRGLRKQKNINQRELAKKIGKPHSFVRDLEVARRPLSFHDLLLICDFFGVSLSYFDPKKEEPRENFVFSDRISGINEKIKLNYKYMQDIEIRVNDIASQEISNKESITKIMSELKEMQRQLLAFAEKERK